MAQDNSKIDPPRSAIELLKEAERRKKEREEKKKQIEWEKL
jgi:hypothetical protein